MSVTYQLTEGEKCKRTLKVEVALERVQSKFDSIYKKLKTEASIPGFRPGKVPLATIKSRFSEVASQDVLEELLEETYSEALELAGLDPINRPTITDVDFAEDKPLVYTAELEIRPIIALERYTGFTLKKPDDQVKEFEVQDLLEHLRRKHSSLESVDRPASENDFLFADLDVLSDTSGKVEQKHFDNVQLELLSGPVAGQFLKQLQGAKAETETDIEIVYPADHFDQRFAGSTVNFHVKINTVKQLVLIELGEEFFQIFDLDVKTLEEFREKLRANLQARKTRESDDALREEVIKEVIDKNRFDLPDSLLNRYLDSFVEDFRKNYKEKFDEAEVREHHKPLAIRRLRWDFLMDEIANKEGIKVKQADLDVWMQRFADTYDMSIEAARREITENRKVADVKETILEKKVIDFIIANSTIETIYSPLIKPAE